MGRSRRQWTLCHGRGLSAGLKSERFIDAESEIAARILGFTVTDDVKPAGRIDSKFGAVPLVDFAISAHGSERRCLGFARAFDRPSMQIAGWYCSAGDEVVDRARLACVLDRLTITSAGGDTELDELFARAERKRTFCGQRNPILAATPEREEPIAAPHRAKQERQAARHVFGAVSAVIPQAATRLSGIHNHGQRRTFTDGD